jgi:small subunit ribosomal protein S1
VVISKLPFYIRYQRRSPLATSHKDEVTRRLTLWRTINTMADHENGRISDDELEKRDESEEEEDFASLFESTGAGKDKRIQRDSKISGTIVSVGDEWVFVDIGGKSEGVIARAEFADENGPLEIKPGDPVTAYVVSARDGEIRLSVKMTAAASDEAIRDAFRSGVPVQGLVTAERKGGFSVSLFGKQAFCPYSQMDLQPSGAPSDYIGNRFTFRISEYSDRGRNIVLSRRDILEEERAKTVAELKKSLKPGDTVTGAVRVLTQFGAFVDIGGVDGLIPMSELAWHRVGDASEILSQGDSVTVQVMNLDWENNRISLSRKRTLEDPWDSATERYSEEKLVSGIVTKLMNFGAFVELEPGVEGLVHVSNLGMGRRVNHPKEVLSPGDQVDVRVLTVDKDSRRIGLELVLADAEQEPELTEGSVVSGVVDSVKDYGVFVSLPGRKSGLLHSSEIGDGKTGDLRKRFDVGSSIDVQVLSIDPETKKIALSTKSIRRSAEESNVNDFMKGRARGSSFGTLGDILKNKIK